MPHIISIFDPNLNKLAEIDDYLYFAWRRKWRRPDEWQMEINRYARGTEYINPENLIVFQRTARSNGTVTENRVGRIEYMELALGESGKLSENWKLRGGAYSGIFDHRIALHDTNVGTGYDVQSGAAETVMRHYVDANCISATDLDRIVPMLTLASDQARGPSVSYRARFQYISQILEELSIYSGLGYEVEVDFDAGQFVFTVYEGRNLSPDNGEGNSPVIFSPEFGNVKLLSYRYSVLDSKNVAIVAGQGEAADRLVIPVLKDISTRMEYVEDFATGIHNGTVHTSGALLELALEAPTETDFGTYPLDTQPADWTSRWASGSQTYLVKTEAGATGGKVLQHVNSDNARRLITWDTVGQIENVEVLIKCKSNNNVYNQNRIHLRASGSAGYET
ncbi:MAG: siphovirus ReqiPepy6 Gp37-like family protein, partial [Anaerovoracaceae bacterium]